MHSCVYKKLHLLIIDDTIFFLDIPDIPDEIRSLRLLQVADFSSNPIPK